MTYLFTLLVKTPSVESALATGKLRLGVTNWCRARVVKVQLTRDETHLFTQREVTMELLVDEEFAAVVERSVHEWFAADLGTAPPFPMGSLLFWNVRDYAIVKRERQERAERREYAERLLDEFEKDNQLAKAARELGIDLG
jgi:hypothetical protein